MVTDYFQCDRCHKQIPATNRTMHALRCDRSSDHHVRVIDKDKDDSDRDSLHVLDFVTADTPSAPPSDTPSAPPSDTQSSLISSEWSLDSSDVDIDDHHPYGRRTTTTTVWTCGVCTFENSPSSPHCQMCSNEHSHQQQQLDNYVISSEASGPTWACSQCTYSNSLSTVTCEMCDGARPPLEPVVEQLIASSSEDDYDDTASLIDEPPISVFAPSLTTSVVLGAGMGAGWAWLNDRDVRSGMLGGAGLGAMTGLLLEALDREQETNNVIRLRQMILTAQEHESAQQLYGSSSDLVMQHLASVSQMMMMSGFNEQESWSQRFPAPAQQVGEDVISSLPVRAFPGPGATGPGRGDSQASCSICLEEYSEGSSVKTLPCLHCFHADCVDRWLRLNTSCPVCKHSLS